MGPDLGGKGATVFDLGTDGCGWGNGVDVIGGTGREGCGGGTDACSDEEEGAPDPTIGGGDGGADDTELDGTGEGVDERGGIVPGVFLPNIIHPPYGSMIPIILILGHHPAAPQTYPINAAA